MERLPNKIAVIIATSLNRNELLFSRAIKSVLEQTYKPDFLLIVDDNTDEEVSRNIEEKLNALSKNEPRTKIFYIRNQRTKGMSGTGAWNTGFDFYKNSLSKKDYVAILDDDDEWDSLYLEECAKCIENEYPDQVVAFIKRTDCAEPSVFTKKDLCVENFLVGNPGIQGSNMFFSFGTIIQSGGFDETLASCTDRDFMLTILLKNKNHKVAFVNKVLVQHYAGPNSVTYNNEKKSAGLDSFYKKYIRFFSWEALNFSLNRAEKLFKYPNGNNIRKLWKLFHEKAGTSKIVIGVAVHNSKKTLRKSIESILNQKNVKQEVWILICDDDSKDNWQDEIKDFLNESQIIYWKVKFNNVSRVRNFINEFIKSYFGNVSLIGRLDSDDEYAGEKVLSEIEKIHKQTKADFILAGNYLKLNGQILEKVNNPTKELLNHEYLLNLLKNMAEGTAENELPSCNIFMTPQNLRFYPDVKSAEDHFLTAKILWNKENLNVVVAEKLLLTIYSLNGTVTNENKTGNLYSEARKKLFEEMKNYEK